MSKGSILVSTLLLSSVFVSFHEQVPMLAAAVTKTTTQTTTMTLTMYGAETSTIYHTLSYVSEILTNSRTTYTTTGWMNMPVWVTVWTTALVTRVTTVTRTGGMIRTLTYCTSFTTRVGGVTIRATLCTTYVTTTRIYLVLPSTVVSPEVLLTQVVSYVPVEVRGTVVTDYPLNLLTTVYSVYAMTTTFTAGGPITVTRTDVLTYEAEEEPRLMPSLTMEGLLLAVAVAALAIAATSIVMLRKARAKKPEPARRVEGDNVFCKRCGAALPEDAEFCPKCGKQRVKQESSS